MGKDSNLLNKATKLATKIAIIYTFEILALCTKKTVPLAQATLWVAGIFARGELVELCAEMQQNNFKEIHILLNILYLYAPLKHGT